jgi:hypothetical protein
MDNYWSYVFVFDDAVTSYEKVKKFVDDEPAVVNWKSYLPNLFLIVSPLTASGLTDLILKKLTKKKGRFIVLDTKTDRSGWLPQSAWTLMRDPKPIWDE